MINLGPVATSLLLMKGGNEGAAKTVGEKPGSLKLDRTNPFTDQSKTDSGGSGRTRQLDDYDGKPSKVTVGGPKPKRQFDPNPFNDTAEVSKPGKKIKFDPNPFNDTAEVSKPGKKAKFDPNPC